VAALAEDLAASGEYEQLLEGQLAEAVETLWSRLSRCVP